jgi:ribosomal protein L19E
MRYYILEYDASGEHIIFKNRDRAMREMLKQYKEDCIGDFIRYTTDYLKGQEASPQIIEYVTTQFESIRDDLRSMLDDGYIESYSYLYDAEVIE